MNYSAILVVGLATKSILRQSTNLPRSLLPISDECSCYPPDRCRTDIRACPIRIIILPFFKNQITPGFFRPIL